MPRPATILELMPTTRGRAVSITPLSGGMTNHNCRVDVQDAAGSRDSYVLRLTGADPGSLGIDRLSEIACSHAAALAGTPFLSRPTAGTAASKSARSTPLPSSR